MKSIILGWVAAVAAIFAITAFARTPHHAGAFPVPGGFSAGTYDPTAGVRHHSGGPYISSSTVAQQVAQLQHCAAVPAIQAIPSGGSCSSEKTTLFGRAADAFKAHPDWQQPAIAGADREIYLVTIYGKIRFFPKSPTSPVPADGLVSDHWNSIVDATTGEVLGSGTAGTPLS